MTLDSGPAEGFAAASRDHLEPAAQPARILVVEDDDNSSALLARELRGLGHTVDTVRYAEDALFAARANDYTLMIVDLGLPDGDGLDLVREMRRRTVEAPIRIGFAARVVLLPFRTDIPDVLLGTSFGASFAYIFDDEP